MFQVTKCEKGSNNDLPLVIGFFEEQSSVFVNELIDKDIINLFNYNLIEKSIGSINKIYTLNKMPNKVLYLVSLGKLSTYSYDQLEKSLRKVNYKLGKELLIDLNSFVNNLDVKEVAKRVIETVSYYNYEFDELKTKKCNNDLTLYLVTNEDIDKEVNEGFNLAVAVENVRDLVNKPYNYLNATDLANYATELVESLNNKNVTIKIYNKNEIEQLGMTAFLGVNKGSSDEPKLIHLKYEAGSNPFIGLVGKGVMFDTGGYSIKENMVNMKDDMAGAASVLGAFEAIVKNELPVNIQVVICATDNKINGDAYLPDDVLTAMNKLTIEIKSTDAEGRLTLADALTFAQKEGCKEVIDVATLTGACVVALGDYMSGLFGNDEEVISKFLKASKQANEEFWHMPINDDIREQVRGSKVADLTNSTGRMMGASGAAAFLEAFVENNVKWMHLDIAGPAFRTSPRQGEAYGATGASVRTIYNYIKK